MAFGARGTSDKAMARNLVAKGKSDLSSFAAQIQADTSLDEASRAEILESLSGARSQFEGGIGRSNFTDFEASQGLQSNLAKLSETFAAARAGESPIFRPRKLQQQQRSILQDMPGRAQTILTLRR